MVRTRKSIAVENDSVNLSKSESIIKPPDISNLLTQITTKTKAVSSPAKTSTVTVPESMSVEDDVVVEGENGNTTEKVTKKKNKNKKKKVADAPPPSGLPKSGRFWKTPKQK